MLELCDITTRQTTDDDKPELQSSADGNDFQSGLHMRQDSGIRVEVFWLEENQFYAGGVAEVTEDGKCVIVYEDRET